MRRKRQVPWVLSDWSDSSDYFSRWRPITIRWIWLVPS
jgi:hypothetical protein